MCPDRPLTPFDAACRERHAATGISALRAARVNLLLRAYPGTEQTATSCVEQDMDVLCSSHGGGYAMQLVRSVCADAGENVATVGAVVAQVSAQSKGRSAPSKSAGRRQRNLLSVAYGLSGRHCRHSSARPARYTGTFRNGANVGYFIASGKNVCKRMTRDAGSDGAGKHWTEP